MTSHPPPKKMPPGVGGEVSTTATKFAKDSVFDGVPQPETVAELIVRVVKTNNDKARSGLRGVLQVYRSMPARAPLVKLIDKVLAAK